MSTSARGWSPWTEWPGVGDDVRALESGCAVGERVGVLVVDEERVGAAHQRGRHGDASGRRPTAPRTRRPCGTSRSATSRCRRRVASSCGRRRAATTSGHGAAPPRPSRRASRAKLGKSRSPCTRATVPICALVISSCRSGADGVTSTSTSFGHQVGFGGGEPQRGQPAQRHARRRGAASGAELAQRRAAASRRSASARSRRPRATPSGRGPGRSTASAGTPSPTITVSQVCAFCPPPCRNTTLRWRRRPTSAR